MRKFNFLDDEKVNREKEKSKLVIAHLYFITFFLRIFIQMFLLVYSTIKIRDAQRLQEEKDKALVDFVLIDFKNDTCDREEDFAAI